MAAGGNGLYVLVSTTGLRAWRLKFRFATREKVVPLGGYPDALLAEARSARDVARKKMLARVNRGTATRCQACYGISGVREPLHCVINCQKHVREH
jgi:hypothetical protein